MPPNVPRLVSRSHWSHGAHLISEGSRRQRPAGLVQLPANAPPLESGFCTASTAMDTSQSRQISDVCTAMQCLSLSVSELACPVTRIPVNTVTAPWTDGVLTGPAGLPACQPGQQSLVGGGNQELSACCQYAR